MRRAFLVTSLLAGVLAFGSMPAFAGVYADVNLRVGHRGGVYGGVYDSRAPRGDWQSGDGYDYSGGQWSDNSCPSNGDRQYQAYDQWDNGGRWSRGHRHGRHWNSGRWNGRWDRDRSGSDWGDSRGYDRNDGYDRSCN